MLKLEYTRNLPHFQRLGRVFFVTSNLKGAIPADVVRQLQRERDAGLLRLARSAVADDSEEVLNVRKRYLAKVDAILDACQFGPRWLAEPGIGKLVLDEIRRMDGVDCTVLATCIMPNHVHLVAALALQLERLGSDKNPNSTNYKQLYRILQHLKGRAAFQANTQLGRRGAFWQPESFDHYIRNGASLERFIRYVLNNPVKAGLVSRWWEWPHHYVHPDFVPVE